MDSLANSSAEECWPKRHHSDKKALIRIGHSCSLPSSTVLALTREVLARGCSFRFTARGYSMTPTIRDGDVLTISPLIAPTPQLGAVVAVCHPHREQVIVHRVIRCGLTGVILQGDHLAKPDGEIPYANILGVVTCIERGGRALAWPRTVTNMHWQYLAVRIKRVTIWRLGDALCSLGRFVHLHDVKTTIRYFVRAKDE